MRTTSDADALLRSIHGRYSGMLRGFVIALPYDAALADDVVQETLLRAWQNPDILTRPEPVVRAWLFTVARNLVTDDLRSARNRREITVETLPEGAHDDDTERLFERWVIAEALATLPADHQAVITGAYHGGKSIAQLATDGIRTVVSTWTGDGGARTIGLSAATATPGDEITRIELTALPSGTLLAATDH